MQSGAGNGTKSRTSQQVTRHGRITAGCGAHHFLPFLACLVQLCLTSLGFVAVCCSRDQADPRLVLL